MRRLLVLLVATALAAEEAPGTLLQSKDVGERLAAVKTILEKGDPEAPALLEKATKDRDWEVVHRAVEALGVRGTPASIDLLVDLAVSGPTRSIRLAAARSAKQLQGQDAAAALLRKMKGDDAVRAAEALAVVADPVAAKDLERLAKRKGKGAEAERRAAITALAALGDRTRASYFAEFLQDADIGVRAAAVAALAATKDTGAIAPLRDGLGDEAMLDVMQRRYLYAIRALLAGEPDAARRNLAADLVISSFGMGGSAKAAERVARLLGILGDKRAPVGPVDAYQKLLISSGLSHGSVEVRRASAHALGLLGLEDSYDRLAAVAASDTDANVRFHALRAAVAVKGDGAEALLLGRLANDADAGVREEAAVILGKRRLANGLPPLVAALADKQWEVSVAAAVSLGKIRDPRALKALVALLEEKDWRRRAGAVVGLGWIRQKEAIPHLIDMTRDKELGVARTAVEFLRTISGEKLDENVKSWRTWWDKWEPNFSFRDRDAEAREAKKYGYAVQPGKVYEDLDIVVLVTRKGGDNIQDLLTMYGIQHNRVLAGSVLKYGLQPLALFVANCPGEIVDKDVEAIQFYVHAGGYLFSSCWALTHTVERCFPNIVRKYENRRQIVDIVEAEPVPGDSPLTEGVFTAGCQPYYILEGSHLVEVLDPERFEVLIDSPDTATRWGEGNLAGWFAIGHGLVLDSANHFDLQGMTQVRLSDEKDRMAFAVDRLGYDYDELRKLRDEGVFLKQPTAVKRTRDLTIFRFITTFVRQKRLADDR
ncbi:MAG TPA: HEAT repeat domain-containing protein [Planctomycetota bacterium]|nr:HEAT repeat domain-containing protein [Planctomycetota bacterium]